MNSRLIQNAAALGIGGLLAVSAATSIEQTFRLHQNTLANTVIESASDKYVRAIDRLNHAGRRVAAKLEQPATLEQTAVALLDFTVAASTDRAASVAFETRGVAEFTRQGDDYRLRRAAAPHLGSNSAGPVRAAAETLAGNLSGWRPEGRAAATIRAAREPGAFWAIWSDSSGERFIAALLSTSLVLDARQNIVATEVDLSIMTAGAAEAPRSPVHGRLPARIGDSVVAVAFKVEATDHFQQTLLDSLPSLLLAGLSVIAVVALVRAQRSNLAMYTERQQEIIANVAANQRALEASEERFRHLAESTNVIPWTADLDRQRFTYVGPQIEALSGYPASTWQASGFWVQHIHPGDRQRIIGDALGKAEEGRYTTVEYRIRSADGSTLHIRNVLTVTRRKRKTASGETTHTIAQGFMLDVTEMKRAAAALEVARTKAEDANRVKSEFLASMSHELRTPLNAVIGFSEIMKDEVFGPLDERYREYAESVHASGKHLLDLINDVLDLSKIEAGRIELAEEPTDLGALMEESRVLLQERMQSAGVLDRSDIAPDLPLVVVDERRIKQVLLNLMSNAIKFTPPGGKVEFIARFTPDRGVMLAVRDTGIGMSPDEIPKALSKFGQIDGELSRKHDGTGLGLPIAKSLIEMHGGALEILSEKGKGTEIRVWLPKDRLAQAA